MQLFVTPWTRASQPSWSFIIFQNLFKLMSIESVMPYSHLIPCCPLLLLPSIFHNVSFSSESAFCIKWPKYRSLSFSISPSNEYSRLISFRIDWFDLYAIQGTVKESSPAPQFESINSSALSLLYGPTLTFEHDYWKKLLYSFDFIDFCDVSAFNTLSMFVIAFLPRSKCL